MMCSIAALMISFITSFGGPGTFPTDTVLYTLTAQTCAEDGDTDKAPGAGPRTPKTTDGIFNGF